ncbi:gamma-tubulin complex component 6 [Anoplophora glabripennis]|uniref:gamma-tubulin complex component 6 n=1 Tax=Anoplophora glabripennis TaxID=217634 RepID=UPI00087547F1|nr:gamma-tubulin complex component 6 [Anoplophora glabripennis]
MDDNDGDSAFKLITGLCEKFYSDPDKVKKSRSKCYEILLGKRKPNYRKVFKDLKGTTDPFCNLLSWQLTLIHDYNLRGHADNLQQCAEEFQQCYGHDIDACNSILQFLLSLRNVPTRDDNLLDLASLPPIDEFENFNKLFKLPAALLEESERATVKDFDLLSLSKQQENKCTVHPDLSPEGKFNEIFKDEGYYSPPQTPEDNIWEVAAKLEYSNRRNWEYFGYPEPDKERPFLSELGPLSSLWVENLESLYMVKLFREGTVFNSKLIPRRAFIRDLKYLLVGMVSDSFSFDKRGEFYMMPSITVEGIAPDTLEKYCNDLMFSSTCYKALNKMSTPDPSSGKYKYGGYIFMEFCESINRYLKFYCTAAFNIPDSTSFLHFHEQTYHLRLQISTLASICKVGPYVESEDIPHGVNLLNYLYQKVLSLTDQKVVLVLYSILYPCCQVYFSRFLKQWILEGTINDPYGEFFIKPNFKYISTRGRTYWTRSYTIREDIVPDFLIDLRTDILFCGKTMNLLKLCVNSSKLCLYLMGKKPAIVSCCLTLDQLSLLKQNATSYYLEVCSECGSRFNLAQVLTKSREQDPVFMSLIAKKRAVTLRRLTLERQKILEEQNEKKLEDIVALKEQYDSALLQKQSKIALEVEKEMKQEEENLKIELKRQRLIQDEANKMVEYYHQLFETAEKRREKIKNHIKKIKSIHIDPNLSEKEKQECQLQQKDIQEHNNNIEIDKIEIETVKNVTEKSNSSTESFYSVSDVSCKETEINVELNQIHSSESMDIINANEINARDENSNKNVIIVKESDTKNKTIQQAIDNFELARKIKHKVMTEEMGIDYCPKIEVKPTDNPTLTILTDAQKNKLKVLSSEFGIQIKTDNIRTGRLTNAAIINRNKVMGISDCFQYSQLDNENFLNKNIRNAEIITRGGAIKKSKSLSLDFDKLSVKSHKSEVDKPVPMSVDSTPLSDLPHSTVTTPSTMFLSIDTNQVESIPNTAETQQTDEGFNFGTPQNDSIFTIYLDRKESNYEKTVFSKRVVPEEAAGVSTNCLKLFLYESVHIPLVAQMKLVSNELLRYFINDLNYLQHLESLRDYFFLQDGEFGRNITENLFAKLYDANFPRELINCRTLQDVVFGAMDVSNKEQGNSHCLSFKINSLPICFDLGNPDVLDCLSLTYKVNWPLNVLLPTDTIAKYDEVFKYLLKLNRVSWVLKKIFLELKILAKETGKKEIYLMASPQYRRLHQCRHIMTHFMQTLQNYIVGEVLQSSWEVFEKNLANVTNIDELYSAHTTYIKNILFMCLLNQKTVILRNVIQRIFTVILKFFDYLRSRSWTCKDGFYVHPNFQKLESIFRNFEELVLYLFKVCRKVAKCGYQPHLIQLLDMLDINAYYSHNQKSPSP